MMSEVVPEVVRIDKWLWCVRLFKTRNQASAACRGGKVKWEGQVVKPSREIHKGEIFEISMQGITRKVKVKELLHNRLGAKLVLDYIEDMTPPEEYERLQMIRELNAEGRARGAGRPTKKERRIIGKIKGL